MDRLRFGKHRGKVWSAVPAGYLGWLADNLDMRPDIRDLARSELHRRRNRHYLPPVRCDLPRSEPRTVYGIDLDEFEAAQFEAAVCQGELVITLDLPCASRLPEAWKRWCHEHGLPYRVREETP